MTTYLNDHKTPTSSKLIAKSLDEFGAKSLLGTGGLEEPGPVIGIVELGREHWPKVSILEVLRVVVAHELDHIGLVGALPIPFERPKFGRIRQRISGRYETGSLVTTKTTRI